jgi:hypothetical protein
MKTNADALVDDYLARLDHAARTLPDDRRADVVAGIREHIDAARESGVAHDEASLRDLLDRLGEPEEIVAAAREGDDPLPPPVAPPAAVAYRSPGIGTEITAAVLLTAGSFIPFVGWIAGVIVAWTSRRWTVGEKLLATLVFPFGPAAGLVVMGLGTVTAGRVCTQATVEQADGTFAAGDVTCSGPPAWTSWVVLVAVALWVVAPFVVAIVLVRRARARADLEAPIPVAVGVPAAGPAGATPGGSAWGALEVAAVLLLALGAFIVPVVGPVAGVVCAWMSDRWTSTEKWVATAIAAIGLLGPVVAFLLFATLRTA